jgi:ubiquinone/menaquinone biosynthesis C-methylase UbiE
MLAIARDHLKQAGCSSPVERQDLEKLSYPDAHFDTIICFRLFHHFPTPDIRQRVIGELCRVARRNVVLSYFSPWSVTSIKRGWRKAYGGKASEKHATSLAEIKRYFERAGYEFIRDFAQLPLVHTLHVAVFGRGSEAKS